MINKYHWRYSGLGKIKLVLDENCCKGGKHDLGEHQYFGGEQDKLSMTKCQKCNCWVQTKND